MPARQADQAIEASQFLLVIRTPPTDLKARHACEQLADSLGLRGRARA
jgi:hypothetical protein